MFDLGPLYESVRRTGQVLKQTADHVTGQSVEDEMSSVEQLWIDVDQKLRCCLDTLDAAVRLWENIEVLMETVLEHLRETRSALSRPLPTGYDELEKDLRHCQVSSLHRMSCSSKLITCRSPSALL